MSARKQPPPRFSLAAQQVAAEIAKAGIYELAVRTGYSPATLSRIAVGASWPSFALALTLYLKCGVELAAWLADPI